MGKPERFSRSLIPWYRVHGRALPWRSTKDPYRIWLSEVILQQTRVDQGMAYWHRFVARYPTVADLSAATEDEVLKMWQGLGYYSRARNLRTAAKQVVELHEGEFPISYDDLKSLKGVGEYTAAAIGSICFHLPEPVVDGNVYRVLARAFGISTPIDSTAGRKEFRELAAALLDRDHPGDHNQAVMELGATICTPKAPLCGNCPISQMCIARSADRILLLPVKAGRTKVRIRYFNYLHIDDGKWTYLQKRTDKGIWQGLYEFPLLESKKTLSEKSSLMVIKKEFGGGWQIKNFQGPVKHVLSHQVIHATFWQVLVPKEFNAPKNWVRVLKKEMGGFAVPRLIERYMGG